MQQSTREITKIAVPVSLEFVIMLGLNWVNQVIVGGLGAIAIAAVGFANSMTFILMVTLGAVGISVSVLVSRAFGGKRLHELNVTVTIAIAFSVLVTAFFAIIIWIWPLQLMEMSGASNEVASMGMAYLQLTALSLIPNIMSSVLSGLLRATDHARSPLVATVSTVVLNTILGYMFVFGFGPIAKMGVAGAGLATLITAFLKLSILAYQAYFLHKVASWEMPESGKETINVIKPLFVLAIPLGVTEFVWTVGIFLYNIVLQKLGNLPLAAAQIATALEGIFIVASVGLANAGQVLVGRAVGAHDSEMARVWIKRVKKIGLYAATVSGLILASTSLLLNQLYQEAGEEVRALAVIGILINALMQPVKVRNMLLGAMVLPNGNDPKGIIWGDIIGAFVVGIPLAILLGFPAGWGFAGVMIARSLDEVVKILIFTSRGRKINWDEVVHQQRGDSDVLPS
jgi:putative MATE family efflux protein